MPEVPGVPGGGPGVPGGWSLIGRRALFAAYAAALLIATHWPGLEVPEGPAPRPDLYLHFSAFGLWTVLLAWAAPWRPAERSVNVLRCVGIASVYAFAGEASQAIPGLRRVAVIDDALANLGGVLLGGGVALLVAWRARRAPDDPEWASARRSPRTGGRGGGGGGGERFVGHARTVAGVTLVSRVSGLARDAVASRVFGTSAVWSAFAVAFMVPNLFRRLFGEGALSAAFIPAYAKLDRDDPETARRFATLTWAGLLALLGAVVLTLELALWWWLASGGHPEVRAFTLKLLMIMLPFAPLVCATAMLGGMLQTHGRFLPPAGAPVLLNALMLCATAGAAWGLGWSAEPTAIATAVAVVAAGVGQVAWALAALRGHVRWGRPDAAARREVGALLRRLVPVIVGMGTLQLGTLIDGLLAGYPLLVGPDLPAWLGGGAYPMDGAAKSVLYFADRLQQFPLGVFGIAIATAVFPALARSAADPKAFATTLGMGLRTSFFIGAPAAAGLMLVAEPITAAVYAGGAFDSRSLERTSSALMMYAPAVWAFSLTHVLTRAFYAGDRTTAPVAVGVGTVAVNVALSLTLMWPLSERGLALATSLAAVVQTGALAWLARGWLAGSGMLYRLAISSMWTIGLTAAMAAAVLAARAATDGIVNGLVDDGWWNAVARLGRDVAAGGGVYAALAVALKRPEARWLAERSG